MKEFSKLRSEAYGDMVGRKQKLLNRSNDAYNQGDLPTMRKAHSLAMKQDSRTRAKYPDESRRSTMSGATKDYADREKKYGPGKVRDSVEYSDDTNVIGEGKRGLWDNIHAKRERIKNGSGERMRKPGSKGAPTAHALKVSAEAVENVSESSDHHYDDAQEHLAKANNADKVGKKMDYHGHMADHHDSLSQWHESKGRGVSADKHAGKSEEHSERYTELAKDKPSEVKEGIMDFMSNTPAKPKSKLSLSAMRDISRKMDTKNKMPKISRASNDSENTNAGFRLVRAEEKDEGEYGYEGDMALNQLATLTRCAEMIKELLKPDTDMPEWVQSKITLATDYIQTAADYMYSEMKEEVEHTDESRQVYYINSIKNKDPAVAQAKRIKNKMAKPRMLNSPRTTLKMGESYSARNRLVMALDKEKKKREEQDAARAAREAAAQAKTPPPEKEIKEGIARLISKNIKRVTATKPTPQQKADIRLNK